MALYVVERYAIGLSAASLRASGATVAAGAGGRYLGSVFIPGDEGSLCLFDAVSEHALGRALRVDATPFERIVAAAFVAGEMCWSAAKPKT